MFHVLGFVHLYYVAILMPMEDFNPVVSDPQCHQIVLLQIPDMSSTADCLNIALWICVPTYVLTLLASKTSPAQGRLRPQDANLYMPELICGWNVDGKGDTVGG